MDSSKSDETPAVDDAKLKSDLFNLVEKLRIELQVKDEELVKEKQEKQTLSADLVRRKARANRRSNRAHELEMELADAQQAKLKNDLFNLVEKLRIELQGKKQELQKKDQELRKKNEELAKEKQKLSANLESEMSRSNRQEYLANEWRNGLANAQQIIHVLQKSLLKSFPSPGLSYYIKTQSGLQNGQFLYDSVGTLRSSANDSYRKEFRFTKNTDGTFSIDSQGHYLVINNRSSRVELLGIKCYAEKFVLFFHQQNQHAGLLVDISTVAGYFLCLDDNNYVVANSRTAPAKKFLLVPVE